MRQAFLAGLLLVVAACSPPAEQAPTQEQAVGAAPRNADEATAQDTCGAAAYRDVIGTQASALDVQPGARVIRPDTMVTDDFVPDRLNFVVSGEGVVTDVRCY